MNSYPVSEEIEREMEQTSLVVSNEHLAREWSQGIYTCASCANALYTSVRQLSLVPMRDVESRIYRPRAPSGSC